MYVGVLLHVNQVVIYLVYAWHKPKAATMGNNQANLHVPDVNPEKLACALDCSRMVSQTKVFTLLLGIRSKFVPKTGLGF